MKNITKYVAVVIMVGVITVPVMAAETTKGTKNYQSRAANAEQGNTAKVDEAQTPAEVAKISPAAGDMQDDAEGMSSEGKSFKEEIRLPRKH